MRKHPVFMIMAVLLAVIVLIALSPLIFDFVASFVTSYTDCRMGSPEKTPCLFLGYDWREWLEEMHFFGWMVWLGMFRIAGIAFIVWLPVAILLLIIYRLRHVSSSPPGH